MEFVLVVPRRELFADCFPQGFVPFENASEVEAFRTLVRERGFFIERARAETDPDLKQIIPYTMVVRACAEERTNEVLLLRRLARGGEARLHDKLSIGVGGHINPIDAGTNALERASVLAACTRRELDEELVLFGEPVLDEVGLLNDDSNPVGAVHLGLVQVARVSGDVEVREKDVLEGDFASPARLAELQSAGANYETWSARLVEKLPDLVQEKGAPSARGRQSSSALA